MLVTIIVSVQFIAALVLFYTEVIKPEQNAKNKNRSNPKIHFPFPDYTGTDRLN
jgi:hypothetical protein